MTEETDKQSLALIVAAKESLRAEQRIKTWEERVQAIARMNVASKHAKASMGRAIRTASSLEREIFQHILEELAP